MPAEMSAELDKIASQVTRLLDQYTERFRTGPPGEDSESEGSHGLMIRGLYLVPQKHVETLLSALAAQHEAMRSCVTHWVQDTTAFKDKVKTKMGDEVYELVKAQIPDLSTMLASARIDMVSIPFGMAMSQLKRAGNNSFLADARARTAEMIEQVTMQLIAGPRQELADSIENLRALISRNGSVSTKSVTPIRRAMEKLAMFDFVADPRLASRITELSRTLDGIVPAEQNSLTSSDNGLLEVLREVAEEAVNTAAINSQFEAATHRVVRLRQPQEA
jgi:hypothetical protein